MSNNTDQMIEPAKEAGEIDQSDEQVWDTFDDETTDKPDDDAGEPAKSDSDDGGDEGKSPDFSSDDTDGDDADDDAPDGTDPEVLRAQIERLQHSLKSEKGRTAAHRREIERLNSEVQAASKKTQRTPEDETRLKESKEKLDAAKEEYGDVIGPLADTIEDLQSRLDDLSKREQDDLEVKKAQLADLKKVQWEVFTTEHPDGFDVVTKNQAAFAAWVDDQPSDLRAIYARNKAEITDGEEAAYLVGLFKQSLNDASGAPANTEEQNRTQTRRERQLAGAKSTRSPSTQRASAAPPKDSADAEAHWDYFERKEKKAAQNW